MLENSNHKKKKSIKGYLGKIDTGMRISFVHSNFCKNKKKMKAYIYDSKPVTFG